MSTSKRIDMVCLAAGILAVILCVLCYCGESLGIRKLPSSMGYEERLFDTSRVHTIDIVMDDWEEFISTCESEEYSACSVVINGEAYSSVGIRGKGNTSLSTVSSLGSERYSFKIEFDQYDNSKSYYGLDKLSLNNLIQDSTMMKDYLVYQLMGQAGAAAPLCSYVYITVNGEEWGLYLAVEGVEDAFLRRNYGSDYGELYKPDALSFGGGRGNGKDFDMEDFLQQSETDEVTVVPTAAENSRSQGNPFGGAVGEMPEGFDPSALFGGGQGFDGTMPEDFDPSALFGEQQTESEKDTQRDKNPMGGFGGFGMGSTDVKLQYIDDDPASYSNIFSSAKTDVTEADQKRLIAALKALSEGDVENSVMVEDVIRYFVVHNFVVNGDSYTGSMIHNYYLYEEDGLLAMLPWDYNLAFGTFQGGDATSTVNTPIDTPVSGGTGEDRPMVSWIFSSEEYLALYHQYFEEFLDEVDFAELIDKTAELIAPYVAKDPTAFYTVEEFEQGVATLRSFCLLREQSVLSQLAGEIPSTSEGRKADSSALVDASELTLSDMGSMGGRGGFEMPSMGDMSSGSFPQMGGGQNMPSGGFPAMGQQGGRPNRPNDNGGSAFPSGGDMQRPDGGKFPVDRTQTAVSGLPVLGVSVLILLAGLLLAFRFKRRG